MIIKVENTVPWKYVIEYLNGEEMFGTYCEKELKKINQTEFIVEKAKENAIDYMSNGNVIIIHLIDGLIKKDIIT